MGGMADKLRLLVIITSLRYLFMTSFLANWRHIRTALLLTGLVMSYFWGVYLYHIVLNWVALHEQGLPAHVARLMVVKTGAILVYSYAGFVFLRQKLQA